MAIDGQPSVLNWGGGGHIAWKTDISPTSLCGGRFFTDEKALWGLGLGWNDEVRGTHILL